MIVQKPTLLRLTVLALAVLALASCKVRVIVPQGGSVTTSSGAYSCAAGNTCDVDVVDFFFDETFIATPAQGYVFKHWRKGDRRFCGRESKPCRVRTDTITGELVPVVQSFLSANDEVFFLQPKFEKKGAGPGGPANAFTLTLEGNDTVQVGTSLVTGDLAYGRSDLTGTAESLIIVADGTTISADPAPYPPGDPRNTEVFTSTDPNNTFVMVVADGNISLSIVRNALAYRYACDSRFAVFMNCGGLDFNVSSRTVTFNDATAENTDTGSVLTINGAVAWDP
tara:strand:- start:6774 stop:7619 length:846 start_codon:yes stop_codon:yes gene_type:complete